MKVGNLFFYNVRILRVSSNQNEADVAVRFFQCPYGCDLVLPIFNGADVNHVMVRKTIFSFYFEDVFVGNRLSELGLARLVYDMDFVGIHINKMQYVGFRLLACSDYGIGVLAGILLFFTVVINIEQMVIRRVALGNHVVDGNHGEDLGG